ncbi:sorting nexin-17-like isoform X2 [Halichondria panicea]|uniref:sorting nexin-17-like isoform X2 n=1 Tax=Halichondria panicea TaxID=6063 RepID=UPI00312B5476
MLGFARIANLSLATDGKAKFTVYNIHMNGFYHCSLRYSQLLDLNTELKANFDTTRLEDFPSKHMLGLSQSQMIERRAMLERYVQSVCQNRVLGPSELVKEFWLSAQRASVPLTDPPTQLEVFLVNGKSVSVPVAISDRTDQVLESVCAQIELTSDLTYYFALFLEKESDNTLVCPVSDYQSPLLTLHTANTAHTPHRLTLRQHFWSATFVPSLLDDKVAKNMLYIEALAAVARGTMEVARDVRDKLAALKSKGQKKEYIEAVAELAQFGYRQLEGFSFNHPVEGMEGCVRVGRGEMVTYTPHGGGVWAVCNSYQLTRIRSWKVGHDYSTGVPWLHINYQLSKDDFLWVQLSGELCVYLNLCLHSTVSELLRVRASTPLRTPHTQPIQRTLRELPSYTIIQAPSSPLESSGSEGQSSIDGSLKTRTVSESSNGNPSTTPSITSDGSPTTTTVGVRNKRKTSTEAKTTNKLAARHEPIDLLPPPHRSWLLDMNPLTSYPPPP